MDRLLGKEISINGNSRWVKLCNYILTESVENNPLRLLVHRELQNRIWTVIYNQSENILLIEELLKNK